MMLERTRYEQRLRAIRLLATDVDGVLTDGSIVYLGRDDADAMAQAKCFHVRDGSAVHIARLIGVPVLVITGRVSAAVQRRFEELPVCGLRQGVFDKVSACRQVQMDLGIQMHEVAFVGDDLIDLPLLRRVGLAIAVADAHPRLHREVDWVTTARGGRGALREVVDDLVQARGCWDEVIADYERRQDVASDPGRADDA